MSKTSLKKVALLTGATGFVGSNLACKLVKEGWEVHALIRNGSSIQVLKNIRDRLYTHPITNNAKQLAELLEKVQPNCVFHVASLFLSQHKPEQIEDLVHSNITFPTLLLEAMQLAGVKRLINTGTSWQHYENQDYNPVNLYAATKEAFEAIVKFYVEAHQFKVCTLKLFDTYGPNDPRPKLISLLHKCAKEGSTLEMSPGAQVVDFVHIDDVVEAYFKAAEYIEIQADGHSYFGISSQEPMHLRDLVNVFEQVTKMKININWGARPYREREVMTLWDKFELVPKWAAKISFRSGVTKLLKVNE